MRKISLALLSICFLLILFMPQSLSAQQDISSTPNQVDAKGRKQGSWSKKDSIGNLVYTGQFKDDKPVGEFRYFYQNGQIRTVLNYVAEGNTATCINYYPSGRKMAEGSFFGKQKDGSWSYFNEQGELASEESYTKGLPSGIWKVYYEEKKLMEEFTYVAGKKEGKWKQFFPNGSIKAEGVYRNGLMQGPAVFYFPDGQIMSKGEYRDDLKEGVWVNFKRDGSKESTMTYLGGDLIQEQWIDKAREKEVNSEMQEIGR
ncbi:MAG: toxin-antitoxin system YwqK family antitoxin [Bacteroidales bacterium]|nr:toxin-antitoxin system YwqK family antitoxin [Bacteroidales bacterium]